MSITSKQAQAVISAGEAHAAKIGVPVNIAVLDAGAHLKAFSRMDSALLGSIDIAFGKARTAALFGMATEAVGDFCKPGGTSPGLEQTNGGLVVFAGGLPLTGPTARHRRCRRLRRQPSRRTSRSPTAAAAALAR